MTSIPSKREFHPLLETLEDRTTPAVTVSPKGTVLTISSNSSGDSVRVRDNGDGDLRINFTGGSFTGNNFRRIVLNMNGGNDRVTYVQTGARTRDMQITAMLGSGNDQFTGSIQGDILTGTTLDLNVSGQGGLDDLSLTAMANVNAGATFRVQLSGGDEADRCDFNYQGELDGNLLYTLSGDSGDDSNASFIRATIRARAGSTGSVGAAGEPGLVEGGFGDDNLGHFLFKANAADALTVFSQVDGGLGTDICNRTANITVTNCESDVVI